ncbi:MAG: sigma-54-dependent Fis family transcriptional regulator [Elusimicrobia bacterium]|nr:sigma-54-dependent Fis family transcriptional regulator [Elusimicrobiota bacterium]
MANILVIDDEEAIGMIFSRILVEDGHTVVNVARADAGIRAVQTHPPDLVFLDLRLPGVNGLEVLRQIHRLQPDLPVVMMTAYQTIGSAVESMKLGANDYLVKPLSNDQIKATVDQVLKTSSLARRYPHPPRQPAGEMIVPVAESGEMREVMRLVERVAGTDLTVLLLGESGTGKEVIARSIHAKSHRRGKPFVAVDCTALPESLLESELFGYEKGAFTGADASKSGKFETARGGTLFLDEIGNLTAAAQMKLLRVIQELAIERLGGTKPIPIDVRLIAATNLDLDKAVHEGRFREDLYHRIKVFQIQLPPLRKRRADLELLIQEFLAQFNREFAKEPTLSAAARGFLTSYKWPGNIRELHNALRSAVLLADAEILPNHLPISIQFAVHPAESRLGVEQTRPTASAQATEGGPDLTSDATQPLKDIVKRVEREYILSTLRRLGWNRTTAAKALNIDYKTLYNKMKELNITEDPPGGT